MKIANILSLCMAGIILMMSSGAMATSDPVKGEKLAKKCKACHTLDEGGKNRLGPNLYGILDSPAGKVEGYKYSDAMAASDIVWDAATFTDFITKPRKVVKGTKMSFGGFKKAQQRADLLAYFKALRHESAPASVPVGNVSNGMIVAAKRCTVCHTFDRGGKVTFGPNLYDMVGKPSAAIEGYNYSDALANANLMWTDVNIDGFLADPEGFLKGTKARFPGLKSAQDRADVLAYMKTLK
ncbi:MAG: c-type cytochrome [Rhodospirillales bacterium]|nr:c-type cytochrome [Rhodospirillales bacterium]